MRVYWSMLFIFLLPFCSPSLKNLDSTSRTFYKTTHFIMTKEEEKTFLSLKTPQERMVFIVNFWERRFPDPDDRRTMVKLYYQRVSNAIAWFSERYKAGYETDRGRVYILIGLPERIETFKNVPLGDEWEADNWGLRQLFRESETRPYGATVQVWFYYHLGIFLRFVKRNPEDEFRMSPQSTYEIPKILNLSPFTKRKINYKGLKYTYKNSILTIKIPYSFLTFKKENGKYIAPIKVIILIGEKKFITSLKVAYIKGKTYQMVRFRVSARPTAVFVATLTCTYPVSMVK